MDESSRVGEVGAEVDSRPTWFFVIAGKQYGPVTEAELDEMCMEGRVGPETLVWREGRADWVCFSQFKAEMPMAVAVPEDGPILTYSSERPEPTNVFGWWWRVISEDYARFRGRARRKEFWSFALVNFMIQAGLLFLSFLVPIGGRNAAGEVGGGFLAIAISVFYLGILVPSLAAAARRLHDSGNSGGWLWTLLLPYIGGLILVVLLAQRGDAATNAYGPDPRYSRDRRS